MMQAIVRRVIEALVLTRTPVRDICPHVYGNDDDEAFIELTLPPPKEVVDYVREYVKKEYPDVEVELEISDTPVLHIYIPVRSKDMLW